MPPRELDRIALPPSCLSKSVRKMSKVDTLSDRYFGSPGEFSWSEMGKGRSEWQVELLGQRDAPGLNSIDEYFYCGPPGE
jgi:hypothetical protein